MVPMPPVLAFESWWNEGGKTRTNVLVNFDSASGVCTARWICVCVCDKSEQLAPKHLVLLFSTACIHYSPFSHFFCLCPCLILIC